MSKPSREAAIDLPAHPDPARGGFVIETHAMEAKSLDDEATGVLRGSWGFHSFEGPRFRLRTSHASQWVVASKDASALIVGREDTLHVESPDACCVSAVVVENADGKTVPVEWKAGKADELELKVPLQNATAGAAEDAGKEIRPCASQTRFPCTLMRKPPVSILSSSMPVMSTAYCEARVSTKSPSWKLNKVTFVPQNLVRDNQQDELKLVTHDTAAAQR